MARGKVPPPPPAAFELEGVRPSEYMDSTTALYLIVACLLGKVFSGSQSAIG